MKSNANYVREFIISILLVNLFITCKELMTIYDESRFLFISFKQNRKMK